MTTTLTTTAPAAESVLSHTPAPAGIAPATVTETPVDATLPAAGTPAAEIPLLILSQSGAPNPSERSHEMTPEQIAEAREVLRAPELPEDKIPEALIAFGDAVREERDLLLSRVGAVDLEMALSRFDAMDAELEKAKEATTLALARGTGTPSEQPEIAMSRAETFAERLDVRVEKGRITPHQAKLAKELVIADGAPNTYALARNAEGQSIADKLLAFIDTLEGGVKAGEASGAQVLPLARVIPGEPVKEDDGPLSWDEYKDSMNKAHHDVTRADYDKYVASRGSNR